MLLYNLFIYLKKTKTFASQLKITIYETSNTTMNLDRNRYEFFMNYLYFEICNIIDCT